MRADMRILRIGAMLLAFSAACAQVELGDRFSCKADTDCDTDFLCAQGQCILATPCNGDPARQTPCLHGAVCVAGFCRPPSGSDGGTADGGATGCVAKTCSDLRAMCGHPSDGCGHALDCTTPGCGPAGSVCTATFQCCTPRGRDTACAAQGCGGADDGCGGTVDCGSCGGATTCGGGANPNACGCTPLTQCQPGWCGTLGDGCGGTLSCGNSCPAGQSCSGNGVPNVCGAAFSTQSGWRWDTPSFLGNNLQAVWMGAGEGWTGGFTGVLAHLQGGQWTQVNGEIADVTWAIWGAQAADVWFASGNGFLHHWNGAAFDQRPQLSTAGFSIRSLAGASASDIWGVGEGGLIAHYNGTAWSVVQAPAASQPTLRAVAVGGGDAWAAGEQGTVLRYTGGSWQPVVNTGAGNGALTALAVSAGNVYLGSSNGAGILHWIGNAWTAVPGTAIGRWTAIAVQKNGGFWASGIARDAQGRGVTLIATSPDGAGISLQSRFIGGGRTLNAISLAPDGLPWLAGDAGAVAHFDGRQWTSTSQMQLQKPGGITKVWGSGPADVWVSSAESAAGPAADPGSALFHFDGRTWGFISLPVQDQIVAAQSFSRSLSVAVTNGVDSNRAALASLLAWNGQAWRVAATFPGITATAAWADSAFDGWIAASGPSGSGFVHVLPGGAAAQSVAAPASAGQIHELWGSGAADIWGASDGGALHYDGRAWTLLQRGSYAAVFGFGPSDVWFAGIGPNALHYTGSGQFVPVSTPAVPSFQAADIWGPATGDVWIGGQGNGTGQVHLTGGVWKNISYPATQTIWGTSPSDIYVGSDQHAGLQHYDGNSYNYFQSYHVVNRDLNLTSATFSANGVVRAVDGSERAYVNEAWNGHDLGWTDGWILPQGTQLTGVWSSDWSEVFTVTAAGDIYHATNKQGLVREFGTGKPLSAIWGSTAFHSNDDGTHPATDVWAVGPAGCWHGDGSGRWTLSPNCAGTAIHGLPSSGGVPTSDAWVVGGNASYHWTGSAWSGPFALPAGMTGESVWTGGPGVGAWASGSLPGSGNDGIVAIWNASTSTWTRQAVTPCCGRALHRIWGLPSGVVYAAGFQVNGRGTSSGWTFNTDADGDFIGLGGGAGNDAMMVSRNGVVLRPNGTLP